MNNPHHLVFVKMRTGEDIVGYLLPKSEVVTGYAIGKPLYMRVETDMSSGRQMIEVREVLPPLLVDMDTFLIPIEEVRLVTPIRDSFKEELDSVIKLFYSVKPRPRKKDDGSKVVPFGGRDSSKSH